jgi:4-hydroxy-3-methylbut-2-enyl diphosphate reductase
MNNNKIKVIIGRPQGFCSGVKRAIAIVKNEAQRIRGLTRVYTLGQIVHNGEVVNELKKLGVKTITNIKELKKTNNTKPIVVIRSHGCAPEVITKIEKLGYRIVDATCPYVKRVQNQALRFKTDGYLTIVVGNKYHPEVQGILGYAKPLAKVYHSNSRYPSNKIGIIAQTTVPFEYFQNAVNSFNIGHYEEIRIFNTICKESQQRQKTCQQIASKVDLMIVVGSRHSANTLSLTDIAKKIGTKVYQVENKSELQRKWFNNLQRIGVIAGASTPQNTVFEVVQIIKKISRNRGTYAHG